MAKRSKSNQSQESIEKNTETIQEPETALEETTVDVQTTEAESSSKAETEQKETEQEETTEMMTSVPRPYSGVYVRKAPAGQVIKVLQNGEKLDVVKSVKDKAGHEWKLLNDGTYIDATFVTE